MIRFYKNYFSGTGWYNQLTMCLFSLLLGCIMISAPSSSIAQTVETWKLVKKGISGFTKCDIGDNRRA